MPSLKRPTVTRWLTPDGRQVPAGTPGASKVTTRAAKWYGYGVPGYPPAKGVPLARDRAAAQRLLDDLVRRAERGQAGLPDADAGRTSLADHLAAFERDLSLGLASRKKGRRRPPSPSQVSLVVARLRDLFAGLRWTAVADLGADAPRRLTHHLRQRLATPRKDGGLSHQTAAFYLAAARRFVWWVATRAHAPVRADLFDDVPGFDPSSHRVHARREATPEELRLLLTTTRAGPPRLHLTGEQRYTLYLTAFATGFRAAELASLTPAHLRLDADPPTVTLPAVRDKARRGAVQPLPPAVADELRVYLTGLPAGSPLWPGTWARHWRAGKMLRKDLEAAGIPYRQDGPGGPTYLDFHALRHSFVSSLAAAGVGPKELQELARHSTPGLTLGVYAHARGGRLADAVGRLPIPGTTPVADPLSAMSRADLEVLAIAQAAVIAALLSCLPSCLDGGQPGAIPGTPGQTVGQKGRGAKKHKPR